MAASSPAEPAPTEVLSWVKTLPLAPEYHPTLAEFQDPISYILKIEKEASKFGICKIVPPLPAPPKKTAIANLNRSFAARNPNPSPNSKKAPSFTTRQQQIGFCPRRPRPVQKPVWQSGEQYTLQQFEVKAKQFERTHLKKMGKKALSPLEIETLFWRACADKPFSVEYANDMPGSGFAPIGSGKKWREEEADNVGETAWNMRGVSRAKGSLLKFMKEDIPGVTSPMVYVAMMFSWFAWHVEDHDLHSLNYLHMGAGKTWYGVPRDAGLAFEDVIRVHGYGGEMNPLVTFAILGEKTTVMPPEVLVGLGVPCCRLVQNAGEFVVTFPGAYHSGFSHGFNCGEAANIATPEWLKVAKEAAIRRASTNYPPMVSHYQLLYALALSLCSRMPMSSGTEPRSSRLKDKMKGEGEVMVKDLFVQNVIQNNDLLNILMDKGSSCIVLPPNTSEMSLSSSSLVRSQIKVKPRLSLGLCSRQEALEASRSSFSDEDLLDRNAGSNLNGVFSVKGNSASIFHEKNLPSAKYSKFGTGNFCSSASDPQNMEGQQVSKLQGDGLLDQGLLSCVTCGILSFACVAVIQPREAAARHLMSADCSFFNNQIVGSGEITDIDKIGNWKTSNYDLVSCSGQLERHDQDGHSVPHSKYAVQTSDNSVEIVSDTAAEKGVSALDLLASAYGDSSDSEEELLEPEMSICTDEIDSRDSSLACNPNQPERSASSSQNPCSRKVACEETELQLVEADCQKGADAVCSYPSSKSVSGREVSAQSSSCTGGSDDLHGLPSVDTEDRCRLSLEFSAGNRPENPESVVPNSFESEREMSNSDSLMKSLKIPHSIDASCRELDSSCHPTSSDRACHIKLGNPVAGSAYFSLHTDSFCDSAERTENDDIAAQCSNFDTSVKNSTVSIMQRSDKDSSRMHVFCLEHAVEVEKQLHPIGGVHVMLLCHPDYPKIESEAKLLAEELGIDYTWKDVNFTEATKEDQERIRSALEDEEAIPVNSDWAVKLGINLYYSANLSKSPLYSKQMPYNAVIYKTFGCSSLGNSPVKPKAPGRRPGRQRKIVVAGKWCGKVWMSNQVHPYLAHRNDAPEGEHVERLQNQCTYQKPKDEEEAVLLPKRNSLDIKSTAPRKSGKKRKKPLRKASTKKPRCSQLVNSSDTIEDVAENQSAQCGRVLRSRPIKTTAPPLRNKITSRHNLNLKDEHEGGLITYIRRRPPKPEEVKSRPAVERQIRKKRTNNAQATNRVIKDEEAEYLCDMEGCSMSFGTKLDLQLHKRNICPVKGCGKKFFSHKYLVQHRRVHMDDRPLKCPWKGCKMTFKWAWARTEHIRVHTGARPYVCRDAGCGQTFRFVSDFSRHKRKTGHSVKKGRG